MQLPEPARRLAERHAAALPPKILAQACDALSENYRHREPTAAISLPPAQRLAAYMITRMPATYAAAHRVLGELAHRLPVSITTLLDLGAGAGAASLAACDLFASLERITLAEKDDAFAEAGRELLPQAHRIADLTGRLPPADLVIAAYSLGELRGPEQTSALARAWESTRVALAIIEPGTPAAFERMRDWRHRLLAAGAHMVAPCPAADACPMAAPDWCHFAARVERSALHRRMKHGSLGYEDEKYCYLAVSRTPAVTVPSRILRRPIHHPGVIELTLCDGSAVKPERVSKRSRDAFRAARKSSWGDAWEPDLLNSKV